MSQMYAPTSVTIVHPHRMAEVVFDLFASVQVDEDAQRDADVGMTHDLGEDVDRDVAMPERGPTREEKTKLSGPARPRASAFTLSALRKVTSSAANGTRRRAFLVFGAVNSPCFVH
jgi:hypothetical protein